MTASSLKHIQLDIDVWTSYAAVHQAMRLLSITLTNGAELDNRTYEGERLIETVVVPNLLTGVSIGTLQADYSLSEVDFLHIQRNDSSLAAWAFNIFLVTLGYMLSIVPKWLGELAGKSEKVSKEEWCALLIAVIITAILYISSLFFASQKKKTMKKISDHFKTAPRSRQAFRSQL